MSSVSPKIKSAAWALIRQYCLGLAPGLGKKLILQVFNHVPMYALSSHGVNRLLDVKGSASTSRRLYALAVRGRVSDT